MAPPANRFSVLIFTDIVGSTDLKVRHGVPAYGEALDIHNRLFEQFAREIPNFKILLNNGDGYFAEAGGIVDALRFALLFQEAMRDAPWGEIQLTTRLGIHAGEVGMVESEAGNGIVSPAADLTARVMSLALGGQILLTRFPFDEARHFLREHPETAGKPRPTLCWMAHGPYLVKGREEPFEIFEVGAEGLAPLVAPPGGEKAKRAVRAGDEETLGWRPAMGLEVPGRPGWHLTGLLGEGGFGEVWAGEHAKLRKSRAFKFCFDQERLRALKREVTLVRLLQSALGERDDIVHLHDLKLDEPPFYLESDLAPHGNLLQWAEKQGGLDKIPLELRIRLVERTATALAAAHSVGVLHKDIKPTNILIFDGPDGEARPRLVDFGIGTLAEPEVLGRFGVTAAGFTRVTIQHSTGTPTYSPPEYLAGRPYTVQGDIYGLGVLLYQLVTCRHLDPLAPGWERDIPDQLLREDISNCVDGDPARRFTSATQLADNLAGLATRRAATEAAERDLAARQRAAYRKGIMRAAGVAAVIVAIVVALAVVGMVQARRARIAEDQARAAEKEASSQRDQVAGERDRVTELFEHQSARNALDQGDLLTAFGHVSTAAALTPRWEYGLDFARIYEKSREVFAPVARFEAATRPSQACLCRAVVDGQATEIAVLGDPGGLAAYRVSDGKRLGDYRFAANDSLVLMTPIPGTDGKGHGGILLATREARPLTLELPALTVLAKGPENLRPARLCAAEAAPVVAGAQGRQVVVWDPRSGVELANGNLDSLEDVETLSLAPGGERVVVTSFKISEPVVWNWQTGEKLPLKQMQATVFADGGTMAGSYVAQQDATTASLVLETDRGKPVAMVKVPNPGSGKASQGDRFVARTVDTEDYSPERSFNSVLFVSSREDLLQLFHLEKTGESASALKGYFSVRIPSLTPHREKEAASRLLDVDVSTLRLLVASDKTIEVYAPQKPVFARDETVEEPAAPTNSSYLTNPWNCHFWAALQQDRIVWRVLSGSTSQDQRSVARLDLRLKLKNPAADQRANLQFPADLGGIRKVLVAFAPEKEGQILHVLWDGTASTMHSRVNQSVDLMAASYVWPAGLVRGKGPLPELAPAHAFHLVKHSQGGLRTVRNFFVNQAGNAVVYVTEGNTVGYALDDGRPLFSIPEGGIFAVSADHRYLAVGNYHQASPLTVWDVNDGTKVSTTAESGQVIRLAFSPDSSMLYAGWTGGDLSEHDRASGRQLRLLTSSVAPALILPNGKDFIGFRPKSPEIGDYFLAGLNDGKPTALLCENRHVLTAWQSDLTGTGVTYVEKSQINILPNMSRERAVRFLDELQADSGFLELPAAPAELRPVSRSLLYKDKGK